MQGKLAWARSFWARRLLARVAPWAAGLLVVVLAVPGATQGNIDAGKTPAQIFSDTCSTCHRRPQELRRTSASFLRQHYTTGSAEASAMASYLAGIPRDTRGKDRSRTQQERSKAQQERPKTQQASPAAKARRTAETEKTAAETSKPAPEPPEETQAAEPTPAAAEAAPVPPLPTLVPFEE